MNKYSDSTAIGIVTCDRPDFYQECVSSIDPSIGPIYVINSGTQPIPHVDKVLVVLHEQGNPKKIPVGWAKNELVRKIREEEKNTYIFLIEDDVRVKDNRVFEKYIDTATRTGLWGCLSYGGHGYGNKNPDGSVKVLDRVEYDSEISIDLYRNSLAAFQLYHRNIFREIGYFDERFVNAAEHLDHYIEQFVKGIAPPFWYFPDIQDSHLYLEDIDHNHEKSVIRNSPDFNDLLIKAWEEFSKKRNMAPNQIPVANPKYVEEVLTKIEEKYGKPISSV